MMILVTGDRGFVGSVLTSYLTKQPSYCVIGLDTDWFTDCLLGSTWQWPHITADIRDVGPEVFDNVDAIVHLAALSNDPVGDIDPDLTMRINCRETMRLALNAKKAGVKRFVFASSQSMYGVSETDDELDEDAFKFPQTAYARSKLYAEDGLLSLADSNFCPVVIRPATVFGVSPRLRTDIVFNNLVACAYTTGKIEVHSDGTPWRPVVHILDLCEAFRLALEAPASVVNGRTYNVSGGNYTVRQLAEAAQAVAGGEIVYTGEATDRRSYRVNSKRIEMELSWKPTKTLVNGGLELVEFFKRVGFTEQGFRVKCNRLATLKAAMASSKLDKELRCVSHH